MVNGDTGTLTIVVPFDGGHSTVRSWTLVGEVLGPSRESRKPTILIVDDDPAARESLRKPLNDAGRPILEAVRERQALEFVTHDR